MKKVLIAIVLFILSAASVGAAVVHVPGEWSEWWPIGNPQSGNYIKRIYDKENKLVCWVVLRSYSSSGVAIDCQPSLELGHPLTQ